MKKTNPKLKQYAQELRKNMTKEESHLWYDFLSRLPITVNRQKVIGSYIADFYCASAQIVIEVDGLQHGEEEAAEYDKKRDAYLNSLGIRVLRYTNNDVNRRFSEVCRDIADYLPEGAYRDKGEK